MMLGLLLARAGVQVAVLEKHSDFLRDFRGDTIHPSTLELLHELNLLEDFLRLPHQEAVTLDAKIGDESFKVADFSGLPTHCRFIAFVPQWEFLNFIAARAQQYPNFKLMMGTEATGLLRENGVITGVETNSAVGASAIRAILTIGADGRYSSVRKAAGLEPIELGAPMDVMWFRLSREPQDFAHTAGRLAAGSFFIQIDRDDYWQCGYVIPKGTDEEIRKRGLEQFRARLAELEPSLGDRVAELRDWEQIKLLTVQVNRLDRWYCPGLLCIGDAAHAMSPVGGVGINLAIQDAVATANALTEPLRSGSLSIEHLAQVQHRRTWPTHTIQRIQLAIQSRVITRVLGAGGPINSPLALRIAQRVPLIQRLIGRMIGLGPRPEHIKSRSVGAVE